jgi:hypothetical protein
LFFLEIFSHGFSIPPPMPPLIAGIPPLAGLFWLRQRWGLGRPHSPARARVWWPSGWPGGLRSQAERAAPYGDMSPRNAANWQPGVMSLFFSISRRCMRFAPYSASSPIPGIYPAPGGGGWQRIKGQPCPIFRRQAHRLKIGARDRAKPRCGRASSRVIGAAIRIRRRG